MFQYMLTLPTKHNVMTNHFKNEIKTIPMLIVTALFCMLCAAQKYIKRKPYASLRIAKDDELSWETEALSCLEKNDALTLEYVRLLYLKGYYISRFSLNNSSKTKNNLFEISQLLPAVRS